MRYCLTLLLLLLVLCLPCVAVTETRVMVVSDTHFLAPELYEGSGLLAETMAQADGKLTFESRTLMESLVAEVLHQQPDGLILTGDLTFNGELASHVWMAAELNRLREAGIPVYVIPGNHDINSPYAGDWHGSAVIRTEAASPEAFAEAWADFMTEEQPEGSGLSYLLRLNDRLWLTMIDTCVYQPEAQAWGLMNNARLDWIKSVLREADEASATVITVSHHNLLAHTSYHPETYTISGGKALFDVLAGHGGGLHLSGHMHIQHIAESRGVVDAAIGSYSVSPHLYAMVTLMDDGSLTYEAQPLCTEHLPEGFTEASVDFFTSLMKRQVLNTMTSMNIPYEQKEAMASFSAEMTAAYFAGEVTEDRIEAWRASEAWSLWEAYGEGLPHAAFFPELFQAAGRDMRCVTLDVKP